MNYKEYHLNAVMYTLTLEKYCTIKKNIDSLHIAKTFLNTINEKAVNDEVLRGKMLDWFNNKTSTIALKTILNDYTSFNWSDRAHFNAFATMDTASIYYNNPKQFETI